MSPIDDELRAALRGRAQVVSPAPDPLAGIERRAQRIRRNRVAASVAGSALAVAAIAAVVPALQTATSSAPREAQFATPPPSAEAEQASRLALDVTQPWPYRGDPRVLENGTLETAASEWAARNRVEDAVDFRPLYGEFSEPSGEATLVYVAAGGGQTRWGVMRSSESGPELLLDQVLAEGTTALPAALPGDEVAQLLVVASPAVGEIQYAADATTGFTAMEPLADGVAVTPLEGDPATDRYRVLDDQGAEVALGAAPQPAEQPAPEPEAPGTGVETAAYAFDAADPWAFRGTAELTAAPDLAVDDERLFTEAHGSGWTTHPLYAAESDAGVSVLFVLHTKDGQPALVSTTWQRGDRPTEQTDQVVDPGQLLIQASVPTDLADGSRLLVALAAPKAGGIALTGEKGDRPDGVGDPGVGVWAVEQGEDATVRAYTEGDGVEYLAEPARTS